MSSEEEDIIWGDGHIDWVASHEEYEDFLRVEQEYGGSDGESECDSHSEGENDSEDEREDTVSYLQNHG